MRKIKKEIWMANLAHSHPFGGPRTFVQIFYYCFWENCENSQFIIFIPFQFINISNYNNKSAHLSIMHLLFVFGLLKASKWKEAKNDSDDSSKMFIPVYVCINLITAALIVT